MRDDAGVGEWRADDGDDAGVGGDRLTMGICVSDARLDSGLVEESLWGRLRVSDVVTG